MPHSFKSFGYIKENCPHLTAFLKGIINFVSNIYKLASRSLMFRQKETTNGHFISLNQSHLKPDKPANLTIVSRRRK